mmetsp:Transcript_58315/g.138783  ORF Transcript_58315/g.138783 Transcript_58315/m.138783 type:complete len:215 (-) Transcript_58315:160-804(-)
MPPTRIDAAGLDALGKKELVEALHAIAPLSFLQENKVSGNPAAVGKKANKDKLVELYNTCFDKGLFQSEEDSAAEKLAQDLARATKLEEDKKEKEAAGTSDVVEEKKCHVLITKKNPQGVKAKKGDKCKVTYVGKLEDGTVFDQQIGKNGLVFKVGSNQVIRGWDEGMLEIGTGESATITIQPEWGYGYPGKPEANIPRNAVLIFDITLVMILA